ncbi:MAG: hypothetical protein DRI26_04715, partial [Chloroflexi bacterium]
SVKCEILPRVQKLYFVPSEKLDNLIDFAYPVLRRRLGEECFLVNGLTLASLFSKEEVDSLALTLPPWILILALAGYEWHPNERVAWQEEAIMDLAQKAGVKPVPELSGIAGIEVLEAIQKPSSEPYWKLRSKGGCCEIFFLTTLNRIPDFVKIMHDIAQDQGFPTSNIGIYVQPVVQGVGCHCEFDLTYNPQNIKEAEKLQSLFVLASKALIRSGAYFSRPYGIWADLVYSQDAEGTAILRKMKRLFDPNNIMNPGKLCF